MTQQIQEAYIVAATRTPVGKAPRGMLRHTRPDDMLAHVIRSALAQVPSLDVHLVDDVVAGCAFPEGEQGLNMARISALLAGLPVMVCSTTRIGTSAGRSAPNQCSAVVPPSAMRRLSTRS